MVNRADEYANNQWEETEEVTKTRKVEEAVTVCHKCWLKRLEEIREILEKTMKSGKATHRIMCLEFKLWQKYARVMGSRKRPSECDT